MPSPKQPPRKSANRGAPVVWSDHGGNGDPVRSNAPPPRPLGGPPETASLRAGVKENAARRSWPVGGFREEEPLEPEISPDTLLGELARLDAQLKNRDDTIGRLNPELGGMERRLQDIETDKQAPPTGLRAWLGRLGDGIGRVFGRDAKADDDEVSQTVFWNELKRRGPLVPFDQLNDGKRIVAFTVFGLPRERLEKVLDTVERYCRKRDTVPVILTDSDCFDMFRARNMAFEYLPPPETRQRFAPDLQWQLYFQRRLTVFRSKWRPAGIVSFGTRAPIEGVEVLPVSEAENAE
jgi:hypothetical protein